MSAAQERKLGQAAAIPARYTWLLHLKDQAPFHYWAHGGSYRCLWYPSLEIVTAAQLTDWRALA